MAISLEVTDVVELKFYARSEGQYSQNVRHYRVTTLTGTSATDQEAASDFAGMFPGALRACMCEDASYLGLSTQIIKNTRRPRILDVTGAAVGTFAGEQLPRQVAGLIRLGSEVASRSGRGRMYVPFPPETANQPNGVPSGAYRALLGDLAALLKTTVVVNGAAGTATLQPILYNRVTNGRIAITVAVDASVWATQRRRSDVRGGDAPPF